MSNTKFIQPRLKTGAFTHVVGSKRDDAAVAEAIARQTPPQPKRTRRKK